MTKRILGVVAVFGLGVGFGCAAAPLVVPKANAQQAGVLSKWEYFCTTERDADTANKVGAEGWELVGLIGTADVCFKRPKL
jgi:hypothetical protein